MRVMTRKMYEDAKKLGIDVDKDIKENQIKVVDKIEMRTLGGRIVGRGKT